MNCIAFKKICFHFKRIKIVLQTFAAKKKIKKNKKNKLDNSRFIFLKTL